MPPKILLLIKQIGTAAAEVDDLGTAVAVALEPRALEAVEGVADALAATHDALVLVVAERALVADARQRRRPHVRVAHGALAVALVAQAADVDAGKLAAHDQVGVVAGHFFLFLFVFFPPLLLPFFFFWFFGFCLEVEREGMNR
jgi:hypothetical protein